MQVYWQLFDRIEREAKTRPFQLTFRQMSKCGFFFFIQSSINTTAEFNDVSPLQSTTTRARGATYVLARVSASERVTCTCRHVQFHPDKTFPQRTGARGVVGTVSLDIKHNVRIFMGRVDVAKQLGDFFVMNRRFFSTDFPPIFPSSPCLRRVMAYYVSKRK